MRAHRRPAVIAGLVVAGRAAFPGTTLPAEAASGCSGGGQVCIRTFEKDTTHVGDVEVKFIHSDTIEGHAHVYGEGYSYNTPNQRLVGGVCAQGKCNNTTQQFTFHINRTRSAAGLA